MPTIVYTFQGSGADEVVSGFDTIDDRAKRSQTNQEKTQRKGQTSERRRARRQAQAVKRDWQERVKAAEAAARAEEKAAQRVERTREQRARRLRRNRARARLRRMREAKREAAVQERMVKKRLDAEHRAHQRSRDRRGRMLGSAVMGVAGAAVGALAAGVTQIGIPAARQALQLEDKARSLSVQARGAGEAGVDPKALAKDLQRTAIQVGGITGEALIDAVSAFTTKTGKFELGKAMAETFGTVARATGAEASDVANAAADMFEKFDIKTIDDMQNAMASMIFQGKEGAFELADAAEQYPKIAAAAQRLGVGKGVGAVRTIGGITQIARQSVGSGAQAATAVEAMFRQLTAKSPELKKAGVSVFDKAGQARDIVDVLTETVSKVGGKDVAKKRVGLQKIFGEEGIKGLSPLISTFAETMKDTNGNAQAASDAVRDKLLTAINAAGSWGDVVEDAAIMNDAASARMTTAWETIVAGAQDRLAPAVAQLAVQIADLLEGGGFGALEIAFDIAAENLAFVGDAAKAAADALAELGLIKPNISRDIEKAKREEEKYDKRAQAKISAKEPLLAKFRAGKGTQSDIEKLAALDTEIQGLLSKRDAAGKRADDLEAKRDKPLQQASVVERKFSDERFFTPKQFEDAFVEAAGLSQTQIALGGEEEQREHARKIIGRLEAGEGVPTAFALPEGQQQLINELGGQITALKQGIGKDVAPEGAIGLNNLGDAAKAAATALREIAAAERADVG